jgi:hypothetical protein
MTMKLKDLGPCNIQFDSVDLGSSKGGVKFRYTEETKPVFEDQKGVTEVDGIVVGASCEVEIPLTRTQHAKLAKVIGASSYSGTRFRVRNRVGVSMLDNAKVLILTRLIENVASTAKDDILTVYKAYPRPDLEFTFDNEGQQIAKILFKTFPGTDGIIWQIGS